MSDAHPEEEEGPKGRKKMVTEDDTAKSVFFNKYAVMQLVGLLDEELLMLFLAAAWVKITVKKMITGLSLWSGYTALAGIAAGGTANLVTESYLKRFGVTTTEFITRRTPAALLHSLTRWEHSAEANFKHAQKEWVLRGPSAISTSISYRVAPVTWGIRLSVYQALLLGVTKGEDEVDVSTVRGFSTRVACGGLAEVAARVGTAPLVGHLRGVGVGFAGQPSLLVEAPYMGLLLGAYGTLRGCFNEGNYAADALCGAVSTLLASTLLHPLRLRRERIRHEHTASATHYHPRPSSFLPVRDILSARLPHALVLFPLFTFISSYTAPGLRHGGLAGWDQPPELDRFGEPIYERQETVKEVLSMWGLWEG